MHSKWYPGPEFISTVVTGVGNFIQMTLHMLLHVTFVTFSNSTSRASPQPITFFQHCTIISFYKEGDLRKLSYFLNKRKELEFYNCHPTEDKE